VIRNQHAGLRTSGGFSLNVFTAEELEEIHLATLEVLERAGVYCDGPEALAIFAAGGCSVDREAGIVTCPAYVVEEAIASAGASHGPQDPARASPAATSRGRHDADRTPHEEVEAELRNLHER